MFYFALVQIFVLILSFIGSQQIIKQIEQDTNYSYKISLTLVELILVQDIYLMVQNLFFGGLTDQNTIFVLLFLGFSLQFSINDNRLLMVVWRLRMQRDFS